MNSNSVADRLSLALFANASATDKGGAFFVGAVLAVEFLSGAVVVATAAAAAAANAAAACCCSCNFRTGPAPDVTHF